jgi:hypothetical protein
MCRGAEGETAAALQQLLLESVQGQQPEAVRMAALQVRPRKLAVEGWGSLFWTATPRSTPTQSSPLLIACPAACPLASFGLQWAIKLFPFAHIPARYLCILSAADPRFQIAEAAAEGLQPGKFAAGGGSGDAPGHPPFAAVLQFVQQQLPQLGRRPAEGASLALPAKVSEAAAAHAASCGSLRQQTAEPKACIRNTM